MKIGIAHASIVPRDAIGHDILGMQQVLAESGFEVQLIGDYIHPSIRVRSDTATVEQVLERQNLGMLIYHHSFHWEDGERMLKQTRAVRVLKYHNVTPPEFFAGYSAHYQSACGAGREQTARLVRLLSGDDVVAADSAYNAAELQAFGVRDVAVVPPFNVVVPRKPPAAREAGAPVSLLFVGRPAPNKGHFDLLNVLAAYVATIGPDVRLVLVGGYDQALQGYRSEIDARVAALGLADKIDVRTDVDAAALQTLFRESSVFLCMSEHEGFCVPVVEAQASGLPIVASNAAALGETIGAGQLVVDPPYSARDYVYIARLVHAVCTDMDLRRQVVANGYRNVLTRFGQAAIADRFLGALAPALKTLS